MATQRTWQQRGELPGIRGRHLMRRSISWDRRFWSPKAMHEDIEALLKIVAELQAKP